MTFNDPTKPAPAISTSRSDSTNSTVDGVSTNEKTHIGVEHNLTPRLTNPSQSPQYDSFNGQQPTWHTVQRKQLLRKIDIRLLPPLAFLYLLSYLDKNALSQAKLSGLEKSLRMKGTEFNTATSIYFVGYIIFQPLSNGLLTRLRPSLYLPLAGVLWGIISASQASCQTYASLVVARFFLGVAEAPIFPGCLFLLSSWYTRKELAHRFAWFFAGNQLANAFGGLIAAGILKNLNGSLGLVAWRWLFIIEGCITVAIAFICIAILPDYPSTTRWLTEEEKSYASWRLMEDTGDDDKAGAITAWQGFILMIKDKRIYMFLLLQHCGNLVQTFTFFFPSIVKTLGYSSVVTLLITAPIWVAAFLVSLAVTYTSGRYGNRTYHIMGLMAVACIGNIIMISTNNTAARFFAMFLLPIGASSCFQIIVTFVASSFPRPFEKRASVVAWGSVLGNSASVYGAYMYPNSSGPRYLEGGAAMVGVTVFVAALVYGIRLWHVRLNRKLAEKEVMGSDGQVINGHADDPDARAVGFRYIL